ncbi:MAG: hypothetical protein IJF88_01265 [Oscillospiraceae bacterium]|nr:hypothetical protein [Oscillospiraceae bacterium]
MGDGMGGVDAAAVRYRAEIAAEDGTVYYITNIITALSWEEQEGQLAQKAAVKVEPNGDAAGDTVPAILKLNRILRIYADWGAGNTMVFEGSIWEWSLSHGQQQELSVTAYDPMIRLQQSKDHKYFSAGMDTKSIINGICTEWGVPCEYKWDQAIAHEKKVFNAKAISDMILELLDEVKQQAGKPYIALYRDGKLEINAYGTNADIYVFGDAQVSGTSDKLSLEKLVTRVKIIGKADDEGRAAVEAVVDGNLDFGVLQEILQRDEDKDLGKAQAEARAVLDERGQPEESILVTAPDLPFLRKGDQVQVKAGNLDGDFWILGVSHDGMSRQMTMTLRRKPA